MIGSACPNPLFISVKELCPLDREVIYIPELRDQSV